MKIGKKYKLIPTEIEHNGKPLYRVKALKNFGHVKAGDVGGYVESEANLSHEGDCWVYDEAKVVGKAEVAGDAKVCGNAMVFGDAEIKGVQLVHTGNYGFTARKGDTAMSKLKKAEKLWHEYCKSTDIKVTDGVEVQLNPSEPTLKVGICKQGECLSFTLEEIKALAKALESI